MLSSGCRGGGDADSSVAEPGERQGTGAFQASASSIDAVARSTAVCRLGLGPGSGQIIAATENGIARPRQEVLSCASLVSGGLW